MKMDDYEIDDDNILTGRLGRISYTDGNSSHPHFHDVDSSRCSGELRDKDFYFPSEGERGISSGTEEYAILWNFMRKTQDSWIPFGTRIYAYRFRLAQVSDFLFDGNVYEGKVRVGIERTPDSQGVPAEKLDVVMYGSDGTELAKVSSSDWAGGSIRKHIGDVTEKAILFCDAGGHWGKTFLFMVVAWYSDVHPNRFHMPYLSSWQIPYNSSSTFINVTSPEALSDLSVGECFNADLVSHFPDGTLGLARGGRNYEFAILPASYSEALLNLKATGYRAIVPCVNHGIVRNGKGYGCMVEICGKSASEMERLAKFRRDNGVDVQFNGEYETLKFERVERPYNVPFGIVNVEYAEVQIPNRKNPIVELRLEDIVLDSARYGDGQKVGWRSKYSLFKERMGKKSAWARLHYTEEDEPYLNIIWSCGNGTDPQRAKEH